LIAVLDKASNAVAAAEQSSATVLQALPVLAAWQDASDAEVERILKDVPNYLAGAAE
jgi:hypothetical protein